MPTGYTCKIEEGISFKEFVLECAKAFVIECRDSNVLPVEIPEDENNYYAEQIASAMKRLTAVKKMSYARCEKAALKEFNKFVAEARKSIDDNIELEKKYIAMREQVEKFVPPTPTHVNLKNFMLQQINDSIKWDCGGDYYVDRLKELVKPLTGAEWKREQIESCKHDIEYNQEYYAEQENRRTATNNWLKSLRNSIGA